MSWQHLLSSKRLGFENRASNPDLARTQFHKDYDRIIFSSPFRRLQNKTQVFPLPGSIFVHNRLTHSLEVASVGRSLGMIFANQLIQEKQADYFEVSELGTLVSVACLAHDLGNPPFGHSGEKAISKFFQEGEGSKFKSEVNREEWDDLINFEGNANTFRILTHQFKGKGKGGYALTYAALAATVKYPCLAGSSDKSDVHTKKYGFFNSEKTTFEQIAEETGLIRNNTKPFAYFRHPLVYLVEAADDICYNIIDLEDAHRLKILSETEIQALLFPILETLRPDKFSRYTEEVLPQLSDANDRVAFVRALVINELIQACAKLYWDNLPIIMIGQYNHSLFDGLHQPLLAHLKKIEKVSIEKVYNYHASVEIEIAGYKVLGGLMEEFVPAIINHKSHYDKKLVDLIPDQFKNENQNPYSKIQTVVDFVSGMTDLYAVELFRKIKGISI